MITHLLDTSVYSQVLRPKPVIPCMTRWQELGDASLAVPAMAIAELEFGLHLKASDKLWQSYRTVLQNRLAIADFDTAVAETFARCKATQQRLGKTVDDFDLAIAAIAIHHDWTLATLNARHFKLIEGLRWEDWREA